jgi:hypothetical protein
MTASPGSSLLGGAVVGWGEGVSPAGGASAGKVAQAVNKTAVRRIAYQYLIMRPPVFYYRQYEIAEIRFYWEFFGGGAAKKLPVAIYPVLLSISITKDWEKRFLDLARCLC